MALPSRVSLRFIGLVLAVGVAAGVGAIMFRELIGLFHNLFFYGQFSFDYNALQHAAPSAWGVGIMLVPVLGAFLVAYLIKQHAPEARGSGVPDVMEAIFYKRGIIRPIVSVVRALSSAIAIGSGASVGREGPIIQIGATFGSTLGQYIRVTDRERILLVACGAGGGIAASFNTPFTGILFAMELLLPEINMAALLPVSLATAVATYISYLRYGNLPFMPISNVVTTLHVNNSVGYVLLSVLLGVCSAAFIRVLYLAEEKIDALHANDYVKHASGMLIVGVSMYVMLMSFGHYYIQGLGYATVFDVLTQTLTQPGFLLFLAVLKAIETIISISSGSSGGIFSPLVFVGATLGAGFAGATQEVLHIDLQLGAVAGIAGLVGASTGAPIMAIIMATELTKDFTVMLPLMVSVVIAAGVRRAILRESVFTFNLHRRGMSVPVTLSTHI